MTTNFDPSEQLQSENYEVLEFSNLGKFDDQTRNEDIPYFGENFVAIVDGGTGKTPELYDGKTSGRVAAELITERFATLPVGLSPVDTFLYLDQSIHEWYEANGLLEKMTQNTASRCFASVIMYAAEQREIWVIGEANLFIVPGRAFEISKFYDEINATARKFVLQQLIEKGYSTEELMKQDWGRKYIESALRDQTMYQNIPPVPGERNPFRHFLLDGFLPNAQLTEEDIFKIPIPAGSEFVMTSDGYPYAIPFLDIANSLLRRIIADDPLCMNENPQTKGLRKGQVLYDDATYIKCKS